MHTGLSILLSVVMPVIDCLGYTRHYQLYSYRTCSVCF